MPDDHFSKIKMRHENRVHSVSSGAHVQHRDSHGPSGAAVAVQPGYEHELDQKVKNIPASDIISYEQDALTNRVTEHDDADVGEPLIDQQFLMDKAQFDGGQPRIMHMPGEMVNYQLAHPECKAKPEINEVSRMLVQRKRSNEPIHMRLYKQDIMSRKIAQEIALEEAEMERHDRTRKAAQSRQRERSNEKANLAARSTNQPYDAGRALRRIKSASKCQTSSLDESVVAINQNPGARLYQKGINQVQEKHRFIEQARKDLQDKELQDFCTFQP